MNWYYGQRYETLLDYKDSLEEKLETLDENSNEYKKLNKLIEDILDIQYYIEKAYTKIEKNYSEVI